MINKIKQLNSLVKINNQKYLSLIPDYNLALDQFNASTNDIANIKDNVEKNNRLLVDLMSFHKQGVIESYKLISNYIKTLFDNLDVENKENEVLKQKVESLDKILISLKIESRGYELLVEKYAEERVKNIFHAENKEHDDNWLLKRNRV